MRTSIIATIAALAFIPLSLAQDAGPSPSESIGCEPHGDHWHCEGPRETASAAEDESSSVDPGPSPTASIGCEPHGDHWHCEGPATSGASAPEASATDSEHDHDHDHDHEDEDHDHDHDEESAAEAGPSPTESIGCEPHGDHWHCDGPRETPASGSNATTTTTTGEDAAEETGAANAMMVPVAGLLAVAAFVL